MLPIQHVSPEAGIECGLSLDLQAVCLFGGNDIELGDIHYIGAEIKLEILSLLYGLTPHTSAG